MGRAKVVPGKGADYTVAWFADYVGDAISDGEVRKVTSTGLTLVEGGIVNRMSGRNIKINDDAASGTIATWNAFDGGDKVFTITNANLSISRLAKAIDAEESGNVKALENYLFNLNWHYVGTAADDVLKKGTRNDDGVVINLRGDDILDLRGGDDDVFGGDGNDRIKGGGGDDRLVGGRGSDELIGGDGSDKLKGEAGDDTLKGGAGKDVLDGGGGDDRLLGGGGADVLKGRGGNDVLNGQGGDDVMRGQAGADRFVFSKGSGDDVIADFAGKDVVDLSGHNAASKFGQLKALATQTNAGVSFDLGADSLLMKGVSLDELDKGDFVF